MLEKREGVLLFAIPYLGHKKILKVFTAEEGLLSLIAKSAKDAWITPFFLAEWVYQKGEKEIHPLKDITLLDPFLELKADYSRITQAGQIAQDLLASQFPSKKSHGLYELAVAYFKKLPLFSHPEVATASFRLKLLQYEGLLSLQKKCCLCPSSPLHLHQGESYCTAHTPFPNFSFTEEEWDLLHHLSFSRQFSQLFPIQTAPIKQINFLFESLIKN